MLQGAIIEVRAILIRPTMMKDTTKKIFPKSYLQVSLLLLACLILLGLGFLNSSFGWLGFICLVPFLFALDIMQRDSWSDKKTIFAVWLTGWIFLALITSWILNINTSGWSYIATSSLSATIIITWLLFSLFLSLGFWIMAILFCKLKIKLTNNWVFLIFPSVWIIAEFLRSWLTTLAFTGPGGTLGNFFNFGTLGLLATTTPISYLSRAVGLYGLSFALVLINISIFWLLKKKWQVPLIILLFAAILSLMSFYGYNPKIKKSQQVTVIQLGSPDSGSYETQLLKIIESNSTLSSMPAKLVVLPEYANFFEVGQADTKQSVMQAITKNNSALYVYSRSTNDASGLKKNEIVYKNSQGKEISTQEKNFLIPTGEYLPYIHQYMLRLMGQSQISQIFTANVGISKGSAMEYPVVFDSVSYGSLACSGVIAPQLYRNLAKDGAEVLINTASLGVFKNTSTYREQAEVMARFIAIANSKPFIQAARGSNSYVYSQDGKAIARSSKEGIDILSAEITISPGRTLYTILGEYMLVIAVIIITIYCLVYLRGIGYRPKHKK